MLNKTVNRIIILLVIILVNSCITEFVPEIKESMELLVVEGLLTDQGDPVTIKLSASLPLEQRSEAKPLSGCWVTISDDMGNSHILYETLAGTYVTPFHGVIGRSYTLYINSNESRNSFSYRSFPVKMKPVPLIDSLYYEKILIREKTDKIEGIEECQIYLDTHDPDNSCRYYRWNYFET